ncbi:MAG: hypothetical protein ACM3X9_10355 [Bacillota bacterium]
MLIIAELPPNYPEYWPIPGNNRFANEELQERKVIGICLIANYASELIYGAGMMIRARMEVADLKKVVFSHPMVSGSSQGESLFG